MKHVLVCTVGTSLKKNLAHAPDEKLKEWIGSANVQGIVSELSVIDPADRLNGAEINSITGILEKGLLDQRNALYLLVSDTEDGALTGRILKAYYENSKNPRRFDKVETVTLEGLSDRSVFDFRTKGLRNLVKAIAEIVKRHGAESVLINATGGYKAQISFAGMIGQALEIPVCYLFEKFSEVIALPPQPISLDLGFWLANASLFFDLAGDGLDKNPADADPRFAGLIDEIEVDNTRLVGLSATGQLFHEMFCFRFQQQRGRLLPPDAGIAPDAKVIKYEDSNKGRHSGLEPWLKKLCGAPYVKRIYTHYHHYSLPLKNYFRPSAKGDFCQVEGSFSDGHATTKFDIVTTAKTADQRDAVIADLSSRFV
ncbi:putative CRISPR-associated protein [Desulfosudis oleivorans]|uniref:Putative CRISPR-associated protein, APE2256 family n=1 Tax=Desulfosudis oleivorans (strain DSM 6200 / JCM 39069 / Hxd3) TaxID=96561 RepID=A8ZV94_DESOH|nr:putative CRISPR-associated protein [Desulfosudis oleivorans]ABW66555.1 putative CRISPR-associated protein, APE2256 family [Desulfosudis oleivorans Hxd3]